MSKEKLYAIKNDDCEWADSKHIFGYGAWATPDKAKCEVYAKRHGGHVVALVEEPEKVVLTKEQAETVERAHTISYPAYYISVISGKDEELLMNAYVNGYTVAKETKYNVKVPHTKDVWYYKEEEAYLRTICSTADKKFCGKFTESEIEHYGLQDCERVKATDDAEES